MDNSYKKIENNYSPEEKQTLWDIAVGLNKVDNLTQSDKFYFLASEEVQGKKNYEQVREELKSYYKNNKTNDQEEADFVAVRMTEFLASSGGMKLNAGYLKSIHGFILKDVWKGKDSQYIGVFRPYNISKSERVLNGDSVLYMDYMMIDRVLEHDFEQEKKFNYKNITKEGFVKHIAEFTSNIWQIHPFIEGNTRTTALFINNYLKQKKLKINNDIFKDNSQYFRDALVMANSTNEDYQYLYKFFEKALFNLELELGEIKPIEEGIIFKP